MYVVANFLSMFYLKSWRTLIFLRFSGSERAPTEERGAQTSSRDTITTVNHRR